MAVFEIIPIDVDKLQKGDVIDEAHIERVYNVKRAQAPDKFRLCQLQLVQHIERRRGAASSAAVKLVARCDRNTVRILTDQEANEHTWDRTKKGVAHVKRQTERRLVCIDHNGFSDVQKRTAESRDRITTALSLAAAKLMKTRSAASIDRVKQFFLPAKKGA